MIGRCGILLKADGIDIDLEPIHNNSNEAGLIGGAHLLPAWMLKGHDALLAVDVGGTNIRVGLVELNLKKTADLGRARVLNSKLWRHSDEEIGREDAVEGLVGLLKDMIARSAKSKLSPAPVIAIGCPGVIHEDGSIARGAQNLPGNWESSRFNLPDAIREAIPRLGDHETLVVMHNDAVVQGLSELPHVQGRKNWGVLTIGTGLGNASFTNRREKEKGK